MARISGEKLYLCRTRCCNMLAVKRTLKELMDGALFPCEHQVHGRGAVVLGEPEKQD